MSKSFRRQSQRSSAGAHTWKIWKLQKKIDQNCSRSWSLQSSWLKFLSIAAGKHKITELIDKGHLVLEK
jgi:hypothetical protein